MSQVWCIVSEDNQTARELAQPLLRAGRQVALLSPDVSSFAMLVNEWGDAVVSAEIREPGILSLNEALWQIEENFGAVDVIALVDDSDEPARVQDAADFFAARWPDADLVIVAPARTPS
jgi:NAD(P)-dependent dehydrogenase (short-subunit alcohol dehydrogenase family)